MDGKGRQPGASWVARALCTVLLTSCGASNESAVTPPDCSGLNTSQPPVDQRLEDEGYDEGHDQRQAPTCAFDAGDLTEKTLGPDAPKPPKDIRVVVVMLENRSFDHYLSGVPGTHYATDRTNPNPLDPRGSSHQDLATSFCLKTPPHEWGAAHLEYDNGLMDDFVGVGNPGGERALSYYTKQDLPLSHFLAEHFAVGDFYFSSLLGPTWPNRLFLFKATSCGYTLGALDGNAGITTDCSAKGPNLLKKLDDAGYHHKLYDEAGPASITLGFGLDVPETIDQFVEDARADQLPEFSMVGASNGTIYDETHGLLGAKEDDDHPAADVRLGEGFLYRVLTALMDNPVTFSKTVLFITFDENGGFYDHIPPPPACTPEKPSGVRYDYSFDRYGFRVPLIVVSPFVRKPGYVSPHVTDHASILRFVEHTFDLQAMTRRDANAWPLLDFFKFESQLDPLPSTGDLPVPPTITSCQGTP